MEFYNENHVKARKPHRCHICHTEIIPGQYYYRESGKYCGEFFDRCTCISCYMVREQLRPGNGDEYSEWEVSNEAGDTFCTEHYETNPCADCQYDNQLHCPRVIDHYTELHAKIYGKEDTP